MSLRSENKNIYWAWKSMKQRCKNPNCKAYKNYGERGIKVCEEWEEFETFLSWSLSNGYSKDLISTGKIMTEIIRRIIADGYREKKT